PGFAFTEYFHNVVIVQSLHQPVGAQEKHVTSLATDRTQLRVHELVSATQCLLENIPPRMSARLALVDFAVAKQPADMCVIVAELFDLGIFCRKIIQAAVADMPEMHPPWREPAECKRRFHAMTFLITRPEIDERFMNFAE